MATTAASITSNFDELQRELGAFNELFGLWTEQRRRVLLDDKESYLRTLAEEHDTVEALKKQHQQLIQQKQQILEVLAEEGRERAEYTRQNEEYVAQRDALKQKLSLLRRETDCYEMDVMRESRQLEERTRIKELTRGQRLADLELYRAKLGIAIAPVPDAPTCTRITYTHLDPAAPSRPFQYTVDHADELHLRLLHFEPPLPAERQAAVVRLQVSGNFHQVLREIRECFKAGL